MLKRFEINSLRAYRMGIHAYCEGNVHCPYVSGTEAYNQWVAGFNNASKRWEQLTIHLAA